MSAQSQSLSLDQESADPYVSIPESTHQVTPSQELNDSGGQIFRSKWNPLRAFEAVERRPLTATHFIPSLGSLLVFLFFSLLRVQFSKTVTTLRAFSALRRANSPQNESFAETKPQRVYLNLTHPEGITWIYARNQRLRGNFCDGSIDGETATWHERAASKMWVRRANASFDASREHRIEYTERIQWKQNLTLV